MASTTDICNLALSHLSVGTTIANVETERSTPALACRTFFSTARDATLRDFAWPFATKIADLQLVTESPNDEWDFSYRYPTDAVNIRRVLSGVRNDTSSTRVPFRVMYDVSGPVIYSDEESGEIEYTVRVTNVNHYPPDFVMALSLRLAAYIAPRVTGGDPFKLGERAMRLYQVEIARAEASAVNEAQGDIVPEAESIRVREE